MAQTTTTITDYLVELADDPVRLDRFLDDPERALASARLAADDQDALRSGDLLRVHEAVASASGTRPGPPRNIVAEPEPDQPEPDEPPPPQS